MGKIEKYSIDFKLQVVRKYEQGKCGYKRLAREFGLSRDTVRDWCLNPRLHDSIEMAKKEKLNNEEYDLEYYKTAALYWETYAKLVEAELEKQNKKKRVFQAMKDSLKKSPETKTRKLCKVAGVSKSTFYYNRNGNRQEKKDEETLELLKKLPPIILKTRGSKAKSKELKRREGVSVNHKRIAHVCRAQGFLAKNRRRKFPKDYYKQQRENKKNLPKNVLNRDFTATEPLKKLCTDVSYLRTTSGWLYLSPVLDLNRRNIVVYSVSNHNDEALADDTLDKLFALGNLKGAILHSDQGVLYTSKKWRKRLIDAKIIQSMSRKGNCWDNACLEHFFGTLKVESGYDEIIKTRVPTEKEVPGQSHGIKI